MIDPITLQMISQLQQVERELKAMEARQEELLITIRRKMKSLSVRERQIVAWRHGIDVEPYTVEQIAKAYHVTPQRINQILNKAYKKMNAVENTHD